MVNGISPFTATYAVCSLPLLTQMIGLPECPIKITCIDCHQSDHYCPKEFVRVRAQ